MDGRRRCRAPPRYGTSRARAMRRARSAASRHSPDHGARELKPVETGLVMLRGRAGGDGAPFNLGEATVTRAIVELPTGERGYGHVLGRDSFHARAVAILDALWQRAGRESRCRARRAPAYRRAARPRKRKADAETAATKVDFFTLVRGEDVDDARSPSPILCSNRRPPSAPFCARWRRRARFLCLRRRARAAAAARARRRCGAAGARGFRNAAVGRARIFPNREAIVDYLKFHTGAPLAAEPNKAAFALAELRRGARSTLPVSASGTPDYPDRSTTLVLQVSTLGRGSPLALSGPGVNGEAKLALSPVARKFRRRARRQSRRVSAWGRSRPCRGRLARGLAALDCVAGGLGDVCRGQGRRTRDPQRPCPARRQAARKTRDAGTFGSRRSTNSLRSASTG